MCVRDSGDEKRHRIYNMLRLGRWRSGYSRGRATLSFGPGRGAKGVHKQMNTLDLFRLDGKSAIVTGGGRGLGRYMAEALSDAGANVALCSRRIEPLQEVRDEIEARGGRALALACDVTVQEDVEKVVSATAEAFGSLDVLVNNSGATWGAPPA